MKDSIPLSRIVELKSLGYEVRFSCKCPWKVYLKGTYVGEGRTRKEDSAWVVADQHARKAARDLRSRAV